MLCVTGKCNDCTNNTAGDACELCQHSYSGKPVEDHYCVKSGKVCASRFLYCSYLVFRKHGRQ